MDLMLFFCASESQAEDRAFAVNAALRALGTEDHVAVARQRLGMEYGWMVVLESRES